VELSKASPDVEHLRILRRQFSLPTKCYQEALDPEMERFPAIVNNEIFYFLVDLISL
jgi:hypothetical protein